MLCRNDRLISTGHAELAGAEVGARYLNAAPYESEEWNDLYGPLRNQQEGKHGL